MSPKPKKTLDKKEFMENLIDSLVNIDWAKMVHNHTKTEHSIENVENWITNYSDDDDEISSVAEELFIDKID